MSELLAVVKNGRLVLDLPTSLPEGTVLKLVVDDDGDDLTDRERRALDAAITRADQQIEAGQGRPAEDFIGEFRRSGG